MLRWIKTNRLVLLVSAGLGALLAAGTISGRLHGLEYPAWAILILMVGVLAGTSSAGQRQFAPGWAAGFSATLTVGLLQSAFSDLYFANNPEYIDVAESLPISPVLFTLLMAPLQGAVFGVISGIVAVLSARLSRDGT